MNEALKQWLAARTATPGLLAVGVRASAVLCVCHSVSEKYPADKMEKILHQLAAAQSSLFHNRFAPRWTTWAFEHGQIRMVNRADGLLLGLVADMETAAQNLDQLSEEFLALPTGS